MKSPAGTNDIYMHDIATDHHILAYRELNSFKSLVKLEFIL